MRWIAGGAFALVLGMATNSAAQSPAPALTPITIAMAHTIDATPLYYALHQGLFEKAGLAITLNAMASGGLATVAVVGGSAQIGLANTLSDTTAHERNIPLVLIAGAGLYDAASPLARVFVGADSPIRTAKDLENHVVAVSGLHDLLALSVKAWLAQSGADPDNVRFVEIAQPAMLPALDQKRVDAIANFEPFASAVESSGRARTLAAPYTAISRQFLVTAWFVHGPWLAAHHDVALRFAQVMHQATLYSNAHIAEMVPIVASYTGMTQEVAQQALRTQKRATSLNPAQLQPVIDAAAKFHEMSAAFPARDVLMPGAP
ncbi:MAG TPA: ABC transporter substrate-binding protein [Candidatus Binatia bacterium]|nr:ABC transporter substrate-binding protein [Candidatus Binatia bacterium]